MKITKKVGIEIEITPKLLAQAFWDLSDVRQADFFKELGKLLEGQEYFGSQQWIALNKALQKNPKAKEMAETIFSYLELNR